MKSQTTVIYNQQDGHNGKSWYFTMEPFTYHLRGSHVVRRCERSRIYPYRFMRASSSGLQQYFPPNQPNSQPTNQPTIQPTSIWDENIYYLLDGGNSLFPRIYWNPESCQIPILFFSTSWSHDFFHQVFLEAGPNHQKWVLASLTRPSTACRAVSPFLLSMSGKREFHEMSLY